MANSKPSQEPYFNQAEKVIKKFGSVPALVKALAAVGCHRNRSGVYRWLYPKPHGLGGMVPSSALPFVLKAADAVGVKISASTLNPEPAQFSQKLHF